MTPITLSRDEARRQLEQELAKAEYLDPGGWLTNWWRRALDAVLSLPDELGDYPASQLGTIIVAAIVVAVLVVVVIVAGPLRRDRRVHENSMFDGEEHTAAELRDEAGRLGDVGEWTQATIQRFRALIRDLGERAVIDESPGMTAHEAVARTNVRLPDFAAALGEAADVFDGLAYGRRAAVRVQYEQMAALDESVRRARPAPLATTAPAPEEASPEGTRVSVAEEVAV